MRWGDAFTTDSNFVNQLGLNGTLTLIDAAKSRFGEDRANIWKPPCRTVAAQTVRDMLLLPDEKLVDADEAAVRRDSRRRPAHPADQERGGDPDGKLRRPLGGRAGRPGNITRTSTSWPKKACCSTASSPTAPIPTRACSPPWPASPTCQVSNT
jgi:hypothetical protein